MFLENKFFNEKEHKNCSCCAYGNLSPSGDSIFCKKHGVCDKTDYCRNFKYDVLKRIPKSAEISDNYSAEDFKI